MYGEVHRGQGDADGKLPVLYTSGGRVKAVKERKERNERKERKERKDYTIMN